MRTRHRSARLRRSRDLATSTAGTITAGNGHSLTTDRSRLCRPEASRRETAQFVARSDVELLEDLAQVVLHRARTDEEPDADLRVREPVARELRDLSLLRGELAASFHRALANRLAGREALATGALGKRFREVVDDLEAAREVVLARIPAGSSVMTNTSVTLEETGIADAIDNGGPYESARNTLMALDYETQKQEMKASGVSPISHWGACTPSRAKESSSSRRPRAASSAPTRGERQM
jgi:hypothetical protein